MLPELAELNAYRLEKDWSFEQLTTAMRRAKIEMSPRTLHYLIRRAPVDSKPLDRTVHKLRKFLAHVRVHDAAVARRSRAFLAASPAQPAA